MNYKEAYAWGVELLEKACVEESKIDAWYLLEYVTKISRAVFYAYPEKELTEEEKIQYEECIKRRAERIPLQHITGVQEFMGLPFLVNEHVLIPRQDTEVLVEQALCLLEKEKKHKEIVRILDLCTGSGCILLSMLHYVRRKRKIDIYGVGSDISKEALAVAVENAKKLGIEAKFVQGDHRERKQTVFKARRMAYI